MESFSLRDRIDELAESFTARLEAKQQALVTSIQEDVPDRLAGNFAAVHEALTQLIEGSSMINPDETILLLIIEDAPSDQIDNTVLKFTVTDSGSGLSEETQERIRRAFSGNEAVPCATPLPGEMNYVAAATAIGHISQDVTLNSQAQCGTAISFTSKFGKEC